MANYRLANSLVALRNQVDTRFPTRSKASDGWIGDTAHQARLSQHNPNEHGVVCAIDITEDLSVGLDCMVLMNELDASNDPRIYYLIHDHQIDNSDDSRTAYDGPNPHVKHLHISVKYDRPELYDNGNPWAIQILGGQATAPEWYRGDLGTRVLQLTCRGDDVSNLQSIMNARYPLYSKLVVDGQYGAKTELVIREFQRRAKLDVDGIAGRKTFKALGI